MKMRLLILPLLLLTSCGASSQNQQDLSQPTTISLTKDNVLRYLRVSFIGASSNYNLVNIDGVLTFAIYDATVTYSTLPVNSSSTAETITLDASGHGLGVKTIALKASIEITDVTGTVTYRL